MKFGKYLESRQNPGWQGQYIDYKALKDLIKKAAEQSAAVGHNVAFSPRTTSLTVQRGQSLNKNNAELDFFNQLDAEVRKVDEFTKQKVSELKKGIKSIQEKARGLKQSDDKSGLIEEAKDIGDDFLTLEKYVNLNYLGFHKILKKHDKQLPETPCQSYYVQHLHGQSWVQGNHSDLLVQLSRIHSILRGDTSGVKNEDSSQGFIRTTTKYWVTMDDVSHVKHSILQHLPVFQYNENGPDQSDSQLINSTYLDNSSLELYHGRLDKRPNALALRIRWYGDGMPSSCFMERKTHRESWKGEESVKDRFTLPESHMLPFLLGEYGVDQAKADLAKKGKKDEEVQKFGQMFSEVQRVVDSKQLHPMIRTQYMRTAFQIPFDATVRVSLDTNLTMIKENPDAGPSCAEASRWYRDPTLPVPRSEYTRFPHAVLEVKLSLPEGQRAPEWVQSLIDSGMLTEVHKFSKFIHGSAVLLPDMVQAVPYWIDDASIRKSIVQSSREEPSGSSPARPPAAPVPIATAAKGKPRRRTVDNDELTHPLLGDQPTLQLIQPRDGGANGKDGPEKRSWFDWYFQSRKAPPQTTARTTPMRIEPKTFFANERTFLSWLHMAITVGSIAAALLGFAGSATKTKEPTRKTDNLVEIIAMILLPVSVLMCSYALLVFIWRAQAIAKKQVGFIDDRFGPLGLAAVVVLALLAIFIVSFVDFAIDLFG